MMSKVLLVLFVFGIVFLETSEAQWDQSFDQLIQCVNDSVNKLQMSIDDTCPDLNCILNTQQLVTFACDVGNREIVPVLANCIIDYARDVVNRLLALYQGWFIFFPGYMDYMNNYVDESFNCLKIYVSKLSDVTLECNMMNSTLNHLDNLVKNADENNFYNFIIAIINSLPTIFSFSLCFIPPVFPWQYGK
ncbi:uncharacterized protein LOC111623671 [Centruroides sculpturatus]|uniref:uncharacterized protein LOC111623671 n=1 Tax=Centruroides sculpturatus TaxID=218467 RepID=UPI000C6DF23D|nr:uncharacterized protein LOC111623671 [Centruroides sculpturatus]